jgi:hypothetical protein
MNSQYQNLMANFLMWRLEKFPRYYKWKFHRQNRKRLVGKFLVIPTVGDEVEDCRFQVHKIVWVDPDDIDNVILDDGANCSLWHCCDLAPTKAKEVTNT